MLLKVDQHQPGSRRSDEVARRFRSELAAMRISGAAAARRCGRTQPWLHRRIAGVTPFDVNELDEVCAVLGISYDFVATGIREMPTPPAG